MTTKFATADDAVDRFEGTIPSERLEWIGTRIEDVEADLILMVPSLGLPLDQIDPLRLARAKALVCDKVLDLYRNPERSRTRTSTSGPYSDTVTSDSGRSTAGGYFTEDEVASLRLRTKRATVRTMTASPWLSR